LISFALVLHQMGPQQPVATAPTAATAKPSAAEDSAIVTQARVNETPEGQVATTAPRESRAPTVAAASAPPPRAPESEQPAARARVPNPALANREAYEVSTVTVAGAREGTSAAPELAAQADAAQPSGMLARREKGEAKADFRSDPDAWMRYIARLRELGRSEEADREYAEFRRVFPAYKYVAPADPPPGDIAPDR
jgi:hypothetical protein